MYKENQFKKSISNQEIAENKVNHNMVEMILEQTLMSKMWCEKPSEIPNLLNYMWKLQNTIWT